MASPNNQADRTTELLYKLQNFVREQRRKEGKINRHAVMFQVLVDRLKAKGVPNETIEKAIQDVTG